MKEVTTVKGFTHKNELYLSGAVYDFPEYEAKNLQAKGFVKINKKKTKKVEAKVETEAKNIINE